MSDYREADRIIAEALEPKPTYRHVATQDADLSDGQMWERDYANGCFAWLPRYFHEDREAAMDALEATGWSYNIYCSIFRESKVYGVRLEPEPGSLAQILFTQEKDRELAIGKALDAWCKEAKGA